MDAVTTAVTVSWIIEIVPLGIFPVFRNIWRTEGVEDGF